MLQEVQTRLERALAQLSRELGGLPDSEFLISIRDGQITVSTKAQMKRVSTVAKNDERAGEESPPI